MSTNTAPDLPFDYRELMWSVREQLQSEREGWGLYPWNYARPLIQRVDSRCNLKIEPYFKTDEEAVKFVLDHQDTPYRKKAAMLYFRWLFTQKGPTYS